MKLELKHIAPYLPYGLKCKETHSGKIEEIYHLYSVNEYDDIKIGLQFMDGEHIWMFKPILRNLSDLTKEIEHNGEIFTPIRHIFYDYRKSLDLKMDLNDEGMLEHLWLDYPSGNGDYVQESSLTLDKWQKLFEWHFDVFGLIEKGLAIDINTLKKE